MRLSSFNRLGNWCRIRFKVSATEQFESRDHGFESQNQLLCFGSTTSPMKNALPHFVVHVSNHVVKIVVVNTILSEIQWKIIISSFENKSQISHQQWRLIKDSFINWISKRFDVLNHDCGQELLTIKCDDTWWTKDLSKSLSKCHLTADSPSFNERLPLPGPKLGSFESPFIFSLNTAAIDHSATVPPTPETVLLTIPHCTKRR